MTSDETVRSTPPDDEPLVDNARRTVPLGLLSVESKEPGGAPQTASLRNAEELARSLVARLALLRERSDEETTSAALHFARLESETLSLRARVARAEAQSASLMRLYVTARQLHAALEPGEVLASIAEALVNLLGAEAFAILLSRGEPRIHEVALVEGLATEGNTNYRDGRYRGGDPLVDLALSTGTVQSGRPEDARGAQALAVVPLVFGGRQVGCVVIERLLAQRKALDDEDRMLLEFLADQAGSALFGARARAAERRRSMTVRKNEPQSGGQPDGELRPDLGGQEL